VSELLSREDWTRLERLVLCARSAATAPLPGRRTGAHRGYSVEFHDYRAYEPGDDPRDIDWTLYGRLDRLFLRLFRAESELTAHLLLDTSASMGLGTPSKLTFASRVAAAIAYVVGSNQERVGLATFASALDRVIEPRRGRAQAGRILDALAAARAEGASDFARALRQYASVPGRRGLAIVVSDAFAPAGVRDGLAYLAWRGFDVTLLHVVSDEELTPDLDDAVELRDVEGGAASLTVDGAALETYRRALAEYLQGLERFCASQRILYIRASSAMAFDDVVAHGLRAGMWMPRN
jgi:uncharacterized protein (DUF58 family)